MAEMFAQCWIPVLEGILTGEDNKILLDLAFDMATWHAYAKLRMHTTYTIESLRSQTKELGSQLCRYANKLCPKYRTKQLPGEAAAAYRRQATKKTKVPSASKQATKKTKVPPASKQATNDGSNTKSDASQGSGFKMFNLKTYKVHALGDYADHIERFGPTDCFSTQQVRFSSSPPHWSSSSPPSLAM